MNIDEVKKHMDYLKNDKFDKEFYVALLLYDINGLDSSEINEELVNKAYEISDMKDSIYDEDIRDEIRYLVEEEEMEL